MTVVARRALRWRRLLVIVVVLVGAVYSVFREPIDGLLTPPCDGPLELEPSIAPDQRAQLELLLAAGLLYCPEVPLTLDGFEGPVYWGSDGVNSVLYLAFDPDNPVSLGEYRFLRLPALFRGDAPPLGALSAGRPTYRNEAPDDAGYYFVTTGAPLASETSVRLMLVGRGVPQKGVTGRDFFTDLENLWRVITRAPLTTERGNLRLDFATVPRRWEGTANVWSDPELDPKGTGDFRAAVDLAPAEPVVARAVTGPLGAGVWVAGVVSGTRPSLLLTPDSAAPDAAPLEPLGRSMWSSSRGPTFALFEFDRLEPGVSYAPSVWLDEDSQAADRPPDVDLSPFVIPKSGEPAP
jgi:hypothetical protein